MKSKSLQNLKVKYYEHTPEVVNHTKSKSKSKSKSRSKSRKADRDDSPVPFRIFKETDKRRNRSQDRSRSKSFSRSPTPLPKTKSMQMNKGKQKTGSSETHHPKGKEGKSGRRKEREPLSKKPSHNSSTNRLPNRESKKPSEQLPKKGRKPSSSSFGKPKAPPVWNKGKWPKAEDKH